MTDQDPLRLVAYCGLYCGLCAERARLPPQARQLQQTLHEEGYDDFYQYIPEMKEDYPKFSEFLQRLANMDCACRSGKGGPPDCEIRVCAKARNITVCPLCKEYPCVKIETLAERYPILIQDGKKMQKVGTEKWIEEQENRVKRGLVYADLRY